ncbi:hypothetical protein KP509_11G035800 [Ceratopteris richardii]|uniref:DUF7086 domain-containing protein n=1 Tax=Ceratopteris richardii TaxID=49495 RepID=A0A8T2TND2_CERRI|nr:hypothetical protein KP509_11G035800 [Ceratopteris richardii]
MSDSDSDDSLRLTLWPPGSRQHTPDIVESSSALDFPQAVYSDESERGSTSARRGSGRRGPNERPGGSVSSRVKEDRIPPPYPWSTDRRAVVQSLDWLVANGITRIQGDVSCKKCGNHMVDVDLRASFYRVSTYFLNNRDSMHDRAPRHWTTPQLLQCDICHQLDHCRPIVSSKKRRINWLFLLLTETLGICTLEQLKYFCKHTRKHRTGAKDRVLYLTYAGLLKQLNPAGPFD